MNTGFIILFFAVIVFCAIVWINRRFGDDDQVDEGGDGGSGAEHDKPAAGGFDNDQAQDRMQD